MYAKKNLITLLGLILVAGAMSVVTAQMENAAAPPETGAKQEDVPAGTEDSLSSTDKVPENAPSLPTEPVDTRCRLFSGSTGMPLAGFNIIVWNSKLGNGLAVTDAEGYFTAKVMPGTSLEGHHPDSAEENLDGFKVTPQLFHQHLLTGKPLRITTTEDALGYVRLFKKDGDGELVPAEQLHGSIAIYHKYRKDYVAPERSGVHDGYFIWSRVNDDDEVTKPHQIEFFLRDDLAKQWRIIKGKTVKYPGTSGGLFRHNIVLERLQPLHAMFRVMDKITGKDIAGASVKLSSRGQVTIQLAPTNTDGRTEAKDLVPRTYRITASAKDYAPTVKEVIVSERDTPFVLTLTPAAKIIVQTEGFTGEQVKPKQVALMQRNGQSYEEYWSDADSGTEKGFMFTGVPFGTYLLLIKSVGNMIVYIENDVVVNGDKTLNIKLPEYPKVKIQLGDIPATGKMIPVPVQPGRSIDESELIGLMLVDITTGIPVNRPTRPERADDGRILPHGVRVIDTPLPPRLYRAYAMLPDRSAYFLGQIDLREAEDGAEFTLSFKPEQQTKISWKDVFKL